MFTPVYYLTITAVNPALSASLGVTVTSDTRPARDLGLAVQPITLNNLAADSCVLHWVREIGQAPPFLPDDLVVVSIQLAPGAPLLRIFMGRVQSPDVDYSSDNISASYTLLGPWEDLRRHTFTRTPSGIPDELDIGTEFDLMKSDGTPLTLRIADHVDLFHSPPLIPAAWLIDARGHIFTPDIPFVHGVYKSLTVQLEELLQYVVDRMDDEPGGLTFQFDSSNWTLGAAVYPRLKTFQDRNVADLIVECLAVKPDASLWFDYTQSPPMLRLGSATVATPESLTLAAPPLAKLRGRARSDLQVAGVVIRYNQADWTGWSYDRGWSGADKVNWYPPGAKADDADVLVTTMVGEAYWLDEAFAQVIYEQMSVLRFAGSLTLHDPRRELDIRPGRVFTVADEHPALPYGQILVQTATWTPATGEWACTAGLPPILNLQTRRDLRGWLRVVVAGPGYIGTRILPTPEEPS